MDTRFPLLQPKHHCVKVTGERPWETNQSQDWEQRWEWSWTGRGQERERERQTGGGAKTLLATHEDMAEEKANVFRSARLERRGETFDRSRRVEGPKDSGKGGRGQSVSSGPLYPSGICRQYVWKSCSKSCDRWIRGVSHKYPPR